MGGNTSTCTSTLLNIEMFTCSSQNVQIVKLLGFNIDIDCFSLEHDSEGRLAEFLSYAQYIFNFDQTAFIKSICG